LLPKWKTDSDANTRTQASPTRRTWVAVEVAEHFGAGHSDCVPNVRRVPAGDVVPDATAAWKKRQG
jgi:hypothetical protein